jgi:hypothetical protein
MVKFHPRPLFKKVAMERGGGGGFCSNMDLSDHAQILYTRGFEGEDFKEKSLSCRKLTVFEIFEFKVIEFP